jgi:hypothetical protein
MAGWLFVGWLADWLVDNYLMLRDFGLYGIIS